MNVDETDRVLWDGRYLRLTARGRWEFVSRPQVSGVVGIVALTQDRRVVLVEEYRPAVRCKVIALPAGLAGDVAGAEHEPLLEAARRELLEETGYHAETWTELATGFTSPGLTDELLTLFLAEDLKKLGSGGGDESESIEVHEMPLTGVMEWLDHKRQAGSQVDLKLFAGLHLAQRKTS